MQDKYIKLYSIRRCTLHKSNTFYLDAHFMTPKDTMQLIKKQNMTKTQERKTWVSTKNDKLSDDKLNRKNVFILFENYKSSNTHCSTEGRFESVQRNTTQSRFNTRVTTKLLPSQGIIFRPHWHVRLTCILTGLLSCHSIQQEHLFVRVFCSWSPSGNLLIYSHADQAVVACRTPGSEREGSRRDHTASRETKSLS